MGLIMCSVVLLERLDKPSEELDDVHRRGTAGQMLIATVCERARARREPPDPIIPLTNDQRGLILAYLRAGTVGGVRLPRNDEEGVLRPKTIKNKVFTIYDTMRKANMLPPANDGRANPEANNQIALVRAVCRGHFEGVNPPAPITVNMSTEGEGEGSMGFFWKPSQIDRESLAANPSINRLLDLLQANTCEDGALFEAADVLRLESREPLTLRRTIPLVLVQLGLLNLPAKATPCLIHNLLTPAQLRSLRTVWKLGMISEQSTTDCNGNPRVVTRHTVKNHHHAISHLLQTPSTPSSLLVAWRLGLITDELCA